jgi:predicted aspartyl protease
VEVPPAIGYKGVLFKRLSATCVRGVFCVGRVWVEALIGNPITGRSVRVRSLVDTGATYTVIPRRVFEELELPVIGRKSVKTARGVVELSECFSVIEIEGRRAGSQILVSDEIYQMR